VPAFRKLTVAVTSSMVNPRPEGVPNSLSENESDWGIWSQSVPQPSVSSVAKEAVLQTLLQTASTSTVTEYTQRGSLARLSPATSVNVSDGPAKPLKSSRSPPLGWKVPAAMMLPAGVAAPWSKVTVTRGASTGVFR